LIACVIALVVWLMMRIRISQLKEKERIENDKIKYQFETLRSQINPHFLFNSFNTLSDIIERRPDDAVEYVEHLSDFFRHILQYKEKDLISLKAELGILEDYLFIQKKRFGDSLNIKIEGQILDSNYLIAPMTLQILAENAIKHNVVSKAKPLTIEISVILDDYVMVTNILQPKNSVEPSTQIGLSNIVSRYEILQGRKVLVEKNESHFIVKIPLIKNV
jgi:LytS/YehU family sensor histidine kinase